MAKRKPKPCRKTKHYAERDYAIPHRNELVAKWGLMNISIYFCKQHRAWHVGRRSSRPAVMHRPRLRV